jgi:hypothetical protein
VAEWPNAFDSKTAEPVRVRGFKSLPLCYAVFLRATNSTGKIAGERLRFFYMMNMKPLKFIVPFFLFCFAVACIATESATAASNASNTLENLAKQPSSKITHDDGWTIVSGKENGERVYWFFAPDKANVSSAMFKKTILNKDKKKQGFEIVSKCDAPKQVCDDLMKQIKTLREKYY